MQVAEAVLAAARRIAGEHGGYATLPQIQADPGVQVHVRSAERVIDVMGGLEYEQRVRMTQRHPVPTWRVRTGEEG